MAEVGTKDVPQLNWDVLVTPGIPVVTSDLPPGMKERMFSPISSTLIYGKRNAVLVDTFLTVKQSHDLVNWVAASGKNREERQHGERCHCRERARVDRDHLAGCSLCRLDGLCICTSVQATPSSLEVNNGRHEPLFLGT